jgi:hypothetical protein
MSEPQVSDVVEEQEACALSELRRIHHTDRVEPDNLIKRWRARWARLEAAIDGAGTPFARGYLRGLCDAYRCVEADTEEAMTIVVAAPDPGPVGIQTRAMQRSAKDLRSLLEDLADRSVAGDGAAAGHIEHLVDAGLRHRNANVRDAIQHWIAVAKCFGFATQDDGWGELEKELAIVFKRMLLAEAELRKRDSAQPPEQVPDMKRMAMEALARAEKATPGPWFREEAQDGEMLPDGTGYAGDCYPTKTVMTVAGNDRHEAEIADAYRSLDDALFIAHAREDVPRLAGALLALIQGAETEGDRPRFTTHAVLRFIVEAWKRRAAKFEAHQWDTLDGAAQRGKALGLREAIGNIEDIIAPAAPEPASTGPFADIPGPGAPRRAYVCSASGCAKAGTVQTQPAGWSFCDGCAGEFREVGYLTPISGDDWIVVTDDAWPGKGGAS